MGASSHSKRKPKPKLEPISLAELAGDSTMHGFTSVFNIPITEAALPHLQAAAELATANVAGKPNRTGTLPDIDTVPVIQFRSGTVPVIDAVSVIQAVHPKQLTGFGNKRIYRCALAQDGHSRTEEDLYQALWKAGKPETEKVVPSPLAMANSRSRSTYRSTTRKPRAVD
jgi:hypothetical protein